MEKIIDRATIPQIIQTAFKSGLNFFCYRLPGNSEFFFGASENITHDIIDNSFVIFPFDNNAKAIISIPFELSAVEILKRHERVNIKLHESFLYPFPETTTEKNNHFKVIESFKDIIGEKKECKIIAARTIVEKKRVDVSDSFLKLCDEYPEAYVFLFNTPISGCWLGASPELLLQAENHYLRTMSLAGTRKSDSSDNESWDTKNIGEQKIVTDFLSTTFSAHNMQPVKGNTFTRKAGPVEHICTPITAENIFNSCNELQKFLSALSPTPALNGFPKDVALDAIKEIENLQRAYYGGFSGPFFNLDHFNFYVTLRCMRIENDRYCIFTGGGITSDSDPQTEWEETSIKASTLRNVIKFIEKR